MFNYVTALASRHSFEYLRRIPNIISELLIMEQTYLKILYESKNNIQVSVHFFIFILLGNLD